jgi:hypothetical protein
MCREGQAVGRASGSPTSSVSALRRGDEPGASGMTTVGQSVWWIDADGTLHNGLGCQRPATDAERWFQSERDRFGEALEQIRSDVLDTQGEKAVLIADEALRNA